MRNIHLAHDGFRGMVNLFGGPTKLQGAESELIEDGGVEKLDVGILEHNAYAFSETERERIGMKGTLRERFSVKEDVTGFGEGKAA